MVDTTSPASRNTLKKASGFLTTALLTATLMSAQHTAHASTDVQAPNLPTTVSTDVLPTPQIDGVAWTQVVAGNKVYVGGKFTKARPFRVAAGQQETPRNNFLAYDINTGELIQSINPNLNGEVKTLAVSEDGKTVYAGGRFTKVGDTQAYRVAAFDAATGAHKKDFKVTVDFMVEAMEERNGVLYFGGKFNSTNGQKRTNLAAVDSRTGELKNWAPTTNRNVLGLAVSPDGSKVVVGGSFSKINNTRVTGWGAVSTSTGATLPWKGHRKINNYGAKSAITSVRGDKDRVYITAFDFSSHSDFEGTAAASWEDGSMEYISGATGDTYDTYATNGVLYSVGHMHDGSMIGGKPETPIRTYQRLVAHTAAKSPNGRKNSHGAFWGYTAPEVLHFIPEIDAGTFTGTKQGTWNVTGNGKYLLVAGEFPRVNGIAQYGLTRFAVGSAAPKKDGIRGVSKVEPKLTQFFNKVTVRFKGAYDRDNFAVKYELLRNGNPVNETTIKGNTPWVHPGGSLTDDVPRGEHKYQLRITDADGNFWTSDTMLATGGPGAEPEKPVEPGQPGDPVNPGDPVKPGQPGDIAHDTFTRSTRSGWGTSDKGHTYAYAGPRGHYWTDGSRAHMSISGPGHTRAVSTTAKATGDAELTFDVTPSAMPEGGGLFINGVARKVGDTEYRSRLYISPNGSMDVALHRLSAGKITRLAQTNLTQKYTAGKTLRLAFSVESEGDRSTLASTVWEAGSARPETQVTATDTFAGLSQGGTSGLSAYLSRKASNSKITVSIDNYGVTSATKPANPGNPEEPVKPEPEKPEPVEPEKPQPEKPAQPVRGDVLLRDGFDRDVAKGWGTPDQGRYVYIGSQDNYAMNQSHGVVTIPASGETSGVANPDVKCQDCRVRTSFILKDLPKDSMQAIAAGRHTDNAEYRARLLVNSAGRAELAIDRYSDGKTVTLTSVSLATAIKPGDKTFIELDTFGTGSTQLTARAWIDGVSEPLVLTATDNTKALQKAGYTGVLTYLSQGNDEVAPYTVRFDELQVFTLN